MYYTTLIIQLLIIGFDAVDCAARTAMALQMFALFFQLRAAEQCRTLLPPPAAAPSAGIRLATVHVILHCEPLGKPQARRHSRPCVRIM